KASRAMRLRRADRRAGDARRRARLQWGALAFRRVGRAMARRRLLWQPALLAALYYAAARAGLQLQFEATQATPIWPASGIALAALLISGPRLAGGVFLGAFLANLVDFYVKAKTPFPFAASDLLGYVGAHRDRILLSMGIGLGNMLEAVIACH